MQEVKDLEQLCEEGVIYSLPKSSLKRSLQYHRILVDEHLELNKKQSKTFRSLEKKLKRNLSTFRCYTGRKPPLKMSYVWGTLKNVYSALDGAILTKSKTQRRGYTNPYLYSVTVKLVRSKPKKTNEIKCIKIEDDSEEVLDEKKSDVIMFDENENAISEFLTGLGISPGFSKYFVDNSVTVSDISLMEDVDLEKLGIPLGPRLRILEKTRRRSRPEEVLLVDRKEVVLVDRKEVILIQ